MAAGRHGGYRSNEFKDRESVLDFKPRDHYYYAKHSDSHDRHHRYHRDERSLVRSHDSGRNHDYDRRRERYERETSRSRAVDERYERESSRSRPVDERRNRYYSSSIDNKVSSKSKDREPGELSSGSGSDCALAYDFQCVYKEVSKIDVEVQMPPAKKQKVASVEDVCVSPVDHKIITSSETSCLSHQERFTGSDHEMVELKEDDFVPSRNIAASRWADEDEGEIVDDDDEYMRQNRSMSSELGELHRESSEEIRAKSSESDGVHSSSTSECRLNDDNETEAEEDLDGGETPNYSDDSEEEKESVTPLQKTFGMLPGCRSVYEFERLGKISEGTYGVVHKAKDKKTGNIVALKKWKVKKDEREGFPITALREISILLSIQHPSVVDIKEVVMGGDDEVFMVMEYMEHDLKEFMEKMREPFSLGEVKCLMLQLLEGVKYLHYNWILHRDLKTSNILMNDQGELKICDFGLSRQYGNPSKAYTPKVVTQWYRAPELLLEAKQYSTAIDMWSLGCIMAELLAKEPLFNGTSELDQLNKIFRTLGTPNENTWPGFSGLPGAKVNFVKQPFNTLRKRFPRTSFIGAPCLSEAGFDLLNRLLSCDPQKRMTAAEAVNHEWFHEFPLPKSKDLKLTFPLSKLEDSMPRFSQQARDR